MAEQKAAFDIMPWTVSGMFAIKSFLPLTFSNEPFLASFHFWLSLCFQPHAWLVSEKHWKAFYRRKCNCCCWMTVKKEKEARRIMHLRVIWCSLQSQWFPVGARFEMNRSRGGLNVDMSWVLRDDSVEIICVSHGQYAKVTAKSDILDNGCQFKVRMSWYLSFL